MEWGIITVALISITLNIIQATMYDKALSDHIKTLDEFNEFLELEKRRAERLFKMLRGEQEE